MVLKQTGTHAHVLAAIGAADVLRHLEPRIVEFEDRFEVRLPRHLLPSVLGRMKAFGGPNRVISSFAKIRREKREEKEPFTEWLRFRG